MNGRFELVKGIFRLIIQLLTRTIRLLSETPQTLIGSFDIMGSFLCLIVINLIPPFPLFHQEFLHIINVLQSIQYSEMIGLFFWGATSVLMVFMFFFLFKTKERIYLHYSLFLFFINIYCLTHLVVFPGVEFSLLKLIRGNQWIAEPMALVSFSFYVFFVNSLLEIPKQNKKLLYFLNTLAISCLSYSVIYIFLFNLLSPLALQLFIVVRLILFPVSMLVIIWIYRRISSPVKFYFIAGSVAYFLGSSIASFRHLAIPFPSYLIGNLTSSAYFEIGILLQIMFSVMAIGQRIVLLHEQNLAFNRVIINQLRKKYLVSTDRNKALELEIQSRASELVKVKESFLEQKKNQLKTDLMNSEIQAKQAQVHPHFIYNSMNALKYMIQQQQNKEAVAYLVRFSRVVRSLLERTAEETIPLNKELQNTKDYLELEKERFNGFNYSIKVDDDVPIHKISLPPLLLQPLAEQVIWQYLSSDNNNLKKLCILVSKNQHNIIISIYIKGINKLNAHEIIERDAVKLARERIDLFNLQSTKYYIEFCSNNMSTTDILEGSFANITLIYRLKETIN